MTLSSVKPSRGASVPVLLNEFPIPPTYIPQNVSSTTTSTSCSNPPPSRPPSLPLPPIPGPSPLSEHDLLYITTATRSRRASRISTSSNSSSWRESVVSIGSGSSASSSLPATASATAATQPSTRNRTESVTSTSAHSVRSYSSNGSLSVSLLAYNHEHTRSPSISVAVNPAILEDEEFPSVDTAESSLTRTSLADIPRVTPSPQPFVNDEHSLHDEHISLIDMGDLPALQDDDTADLDSQAHTLHVQMRAARSKSPMHKSRILQAVPLHRRNSSPIGEKSHERFPSTSQHPRNRESFHEAAHASTTFPGVPLPVGSDRASSPDIATFIAETPRPRRRSGTSSTRSRSRSQSRRRAPKSLPGSRRTSSIGKLSVFSLPDKATRCQSEGGVTLASRSLLPYANKGDDDELWNDDSFMEGYGVVIKGGDFVNLPDEEDAAGESDSSLDLHTPLPNLMLRDGMLSPYSKLLPQNMRSDSPMVPTDGNQPGSTVAVTIPITKSGVFKDERDTIRRRVRHRDGRLLRGGIGLTTGLGWSDSEDEDAPSPLTRRLSRLALSRQPSVASVKTVPRSSRSHPHPLSRSFSADAKIHPSKSTQELRLPSVPPTTRQKRSRAMASTLTLNIPEHDSPSLAPSSARFSEPTPSRVDIHRGSQPNDQVRTPSSSSSTRSLPGPITPDVMELPPHSAPPRSWDRDKSLPPLPLSRGSLIMSPRPIESLLDTKSRTPKPGVPSTSRPISSGSELSDSPGLSSEIPKIPHTYTASTLPTIRSTPRPLQLSASLGVGLQPGEPGSKQGLLLSYNRQLHDQQRARALTGPSLAASASHHHGGRPYGSIATPGLPRSGSMDFTLSEHGEARLRPRTGTGMVYKKSSTSLTRAAADVQAQSRIRMISERTGPIAL